MNRNMFVVLIGTLIVIEGSCQSLTNGLIAYYPFNGNVNDESGNKNNLQVYNVNITSNRFFDATMLSKGTNSCYFNGKNSWMETYKPILYGDSPLTFSFWARTIRYSNMDILGIASPNGDNRDIRIMFNATQLFQKGVSFKNEIHIATYPFKTYDDIWHHYVIVLGDNNNFWYENFKVYVDGSLISVGNTFNWGRWEYSKLDVPLTIGKPFVTGNFFEGYLDDIRIYNRALSSDEVGTLFEMESQISYIEKKMLMLYFTNPHPYKCYKLFYTHEYVYWDIFVGGQLIKVLKPNYYYVGSKTIDNCKSINKFVINGINNNNKFYYLFEKLNEDWDTSFIPSTNKLSMKLLYN